MRGMTTGLALLAGALSLAVPAPAPPPPPPPPGAPPRVRPPVPPARVSLAVEPSGHFAAAYDDRLTRDALRFAEQVGGQWRSTVIATDFDGLRVGREPALAIAPDGSRVIAFRSDLSFNPRVAPSGVLL